MTLQQSLALGLPIGGPNQPGGPLYSPITAIVNGGAAGTKKLLGDIFDRKSAKSAAEIEAEAAARLRDVDFPSTVH